MIQKAPRGLCLIIRPMGHRLTKIVTRTGDDGTTGLGDGRRVRKDAPRIQALGELDELNSALGCVLAEELPAELRAPLDAVQNDLFDLGGEVGIPGRTAMQPAHVAALERAIEALNATLPPLREFILPGGTRAASACQLARATCRRAERALVALAAHESVSPAALQYLNRLSDLLFVAARAANRAAGRAEAQWRPGHGVAK
jgi:cob(I)alamin adenosyltransferase